MKGSLLLQEKWHFCCLFPMKKSPIVYLTGQNKMLFNMQIENQPKLY